MPEEAFINYARFIFELGLPIHWRHHHLPWPVDNRTVLRCQLPVGTRTPRREWNDQS